MADGQHLASFRDPAGFLFSRDGCLYRQVNQYARDAYDRLMQSGLYDELVAEGSLIPHTEMGSLPCATVEGYRIIQPDPIPFISYPYEWCFSQLRDAALLTLHLQRTALRYAMSLKDCSAYNVQFHHGKPIFIDTLSFEPHRPGKPWVAYRQFCQHFLAPLALMAYVDIELQKLLVTHLDGIPLPLASRLLPWNTRLKLPLYLHLHLHARFQRSAAGTATPTAPRGQVSPQAQAALLDDLESAIRGLRWEPHGTEWGDYYDETNYSAAAFAHKKALVAAYLDRIAPGTVWDLGANTGVFSRLAAARGCRTLAFDVDAAAVEKGYRACRASDEKHLLPLVIDLTNPSPGIGWMGEERAALLARGPADLIMALALEHHLVITNNVPFSRLADCFATLGRSLIIEFVPPDDSQIRRMLALRDDGVPGYTQEAFEQAFRQHFAILAREQLRDHGRVLYLMQREGT